MIGNVILAKKVRRIAILVVVCLLCLLNNPVFAAEEQAADDTEQASAAAESADKFSYDPVGNRDPFQPLMDEVRKTVGKPDRVREPLEKFELSQLRLMAMILVKDTPKAMVKAPDGKSYIVKVGDRIGKFGGKVVALEPKQIDPNTRAVISPDRIKIREVGNDPYTLQEIVDYRYITL